MTIATILSLGETALKLGLICSLTVLALFLSYSMLNVCDLSTDGCFTLGAAVGAAVAVSGHPFLSIFAAMAAGICSGFVTAILQTKLGVDSLLAGIIVNTALYSVNIAVMGGSSLINMNRTETVFSMMKETLKSTPSEMEPYINDWKLPVVDLKTMDARKLMNRRLRDVVEIDQSMFAGSYDGLRENRKIETESFMMAATFTCTNIRREDLPEGNEINMCKAMDQLFQRMRDEEKLNTLKELLKVKLGTLSSPLEKQFTNTLLEKLNELTLNIFNINSEEDILKIIN